MLPSRQTISMQSDLPSVMEKFVRQADWGFCMDLIGGLQENLTLEAPVPIGVARGHLVQVVGRWTKKSLLREMGFLKGVFSKPDTFTWAGLENGVEMDTFVEKSSAVPYFGGACPSFHSPDLFWRFNDGAEERAVESMQGVSAEETRKWTDYGRLASQDLPADRHLLRNTSMLLAARRFNEQFDRLFEGRGKINRTETVNLLAGIVSDAVSCAAGRIFWGQGEEFANVELRVAEMASNLLMANAVARTGAIQRVPQRSINNLGKVLRHPGATLGEIFGDWSSSILFDFDDGVGGAIVLPPGSLISFPFIGLPVPRVRCDRGLVVFFHIQPTSGVRKFDEVSMNVGYWDQTTEQFANAVGGVITQESNIAALTLLEAAFSASRSSANQQREDAPE